MANTKPYQPATARQRLPRKTPYELGTIAARLGSIRGCPFGAGPRQDEFMQGYQDETLSMAKELQPAA